MFSLDVALDNGVSFALCQLLCNTYSLTVLHARQIVDALSDPPIMPKYRVSIKSSIVLYYTIRLLVLFEECFFPCRMTNCSYYLFFISMLFPYLLPSIVHVSADLSHIYTVVNPCFLTSMLGSVLQSVLVSVFIP